MTDLTDLLAGLTTARLAAWWADYGTAATVVGLTAALALVALTGLVARRHGRGLPWLANATSGVVLLVSSEGMFVVAVDRLELPLWFAVVVFGVGELLLIYNALQARAFLLQAAAARADALEADALNGPGAGDPAREREVDLRQRAARRRLLVWIVAVVSGAIVALNVETAGEAALRFVLPLAAASQWLDSITPPSDGKRVGVSLWAPLRKLLIRGGLIPPAEQDVATIDREYQVRAMVNLAVTLELAPDGRRAARRERRLIRIAQTVDPGMIAEAAERVDNALSIRRRLAPSGSAATEEAASRTVPAATPQSHDTPAHVDSSTVPPASGSTPEPTATPVEHLTISFPPDDEEVSIYSASETVTAERVSRWLAEKVIAEQPADSSLSTGNGNSNSAFAAAPVHGRATASDQAETPRAETSPQRASSYGARSRADEVARQLRAAIDDGRLSPDAPVTHVMSELGTSYRNAKAALELVDGS